MILKALSDHAVSVGLIEGMDSKRRPVHLVLRIDHDGQVLLDDPWGVRSQTVVDLKKGTKKEEVGELMLMPEYPGVNAGGKAHFLADSAEKILGLYAKDDEKKGIKAGEPIPDDGKNAAKAFDHYWKRISDAFAETKDAELGTMLKFRDLYLTGADRKESLEAIAGVRPHGKDGKPVFVAIGSARAEPLEGRTITFQVGATNPHVYAEGSPLRDYWKKQFTRERFAEAPQGSTANLGFCLVTADPENPVQVPIAEVHRTLIKGVPGLPPIGGYMVSFDEMTPSLRSYGFEKGWNAPVSEDAAAAYALGLNHLLANRDTARKRGDSVLCSWVDLSEKAAVALMDWIDAPTADSRTKFFDGIDEGHLIQALKSWHYRSLTLAANGGRVVVRRWLDVPLGEVVKAAERWFDDLDTEAIDIPKKVEKGGKRKSDTPAEPAATTMVYNPLSIYNLAATTVRVPSETQTTTYDLLYRAALDPARFNPLSLLAPILQRLKIEAASRGNGIRFDTSRFALIKLILKRTGDRPMPVERDPSKKIESIALWKAKAYGPPAVERTLCVTNDRPYNCGRLLAVLDDLQRAAQGNVGADIVSRFYGAASTYPGNVFGSLMKLAKVHEKKLKKSGDAKKKNKGWALSSRVNDIHSLIRQEEPSDVSEFPNILNPREQGRFALGFHQQKAADERAIKQYLADKAAGKAVEDPTLDALADYESNPVAESE